MEMEDKKFFAIHTTTAGEEMVQRLIMSIIPYVKPEDFFAPLRTYYTRTSHRMREHVKDLFPGYIFVKTDDAEHLFFDLKKVPEFTNLLHDGEYAFVALDENECRFISLLCSLGLSEINKKGTGVRKFILPCSRVELIPREEILPGDVIRDRDNKDEVLRVIDGPLLKLNEYVSRINFKKRIAILDKELCGEHEIHIGIRLPKDKLDSEK